VATIQFNSVNFRALFPAFANVTTYPDSLLQLIWNNATAYLSNNTACGWYSGMNCNQQTLALNYMTAHLLAIAGQIAAGDTPGIVTGATIDKISVTIQPPPETTQWQWWLNQTPYGQQLLALLQVAAAGGRFYNRIPVLTAFRR